MLELYLLNAICRITNSNYPRTAEKIFLIAIKGKRKILLKEISTTDVYSHNCEIFSEGRSTQFSVSHNNCITSVCVKNVDLLTFLGPSVAILR